MATGTVQLDIFSGQPNPTWSISDAQISRLMEMVLALPRSTMDVTRPSLGYRGMTVSIDDEKAPQVTVGGGVVAINGNRYADPERRLERWLLGTGRSSLAPDIYAFVEGEF